MQSTGAFLKLSELSPSKCTYFRGILSKNFLKILTCDFKVVVTKKRRNEKTLLKKIYPFKHDSVVFRQAYHQAHVC